MSPSLLFGYIKANIGELFPGGANSEDPQGSSVVKGRLYRLVTAQVGPIPYWPEVVCIAVANYSFTFKVTPNHPLVGTARHGVFVDSSGEMWMFQEGAGEKGESPTNAHIAYTFGAIMWPHFAHNVREKIGTATVADRAEDGAINAAGAYLAYKAVKWMLGP